MSMTDEEVEQAYVRGRQAGWRAILGEAIGHVVSDEESGLAHSVMAAKLAKRLSEAREALRIVCAEFGDNDWSDDLHLADVIEKHLARHLRDARRGRTNE